MQAPLQSEDGMSFTARIGSGPLPAAGTAPPPLPIIAVHPPGNTPCILIIILIMMSFLLAGPVHGPRRTASTASRGFCAAGSSNTPDRL